MIGQKKIIEEFDGTINISSNIKANKRTIIGKFDLRDLLFILIAIVVGIVILSLLFAINMIKNLFIDFIVLAIFEVPILTLGFMKIHNMHFLDYIKLKEKSDNKPYRSQVVRKKNDRLREYINEYIITVEVIDKGDIMNDIERVVNAIKKNVFFKDMQIKFIKRKVFVSVKLKASNINLITFGNDKTKEKAHDIDYNGLLDYFHNNDSIKFVSYEDMCIYDLYIRTLKIQDKKYSKEQEKTIEKLKNKLLNVKIPSYVSDDGLLKDEKVNKIAKINYKTCTCLSKVIIEDKKSNKLKVYKIILYKDPFNILFLKDIKENYDVTIYMSIKDVFDINRANYIETYIAIIGDESGISGKSVELEILFNKYKILYKTINEDKIKDTINFFMENKY